MLYEDAADKRSNVGMVKDVVEGAREVLLRAVAGGNKAVVRGSRILKQLLGVAIVQVLVGDHWITIVEESAVQSCRQIPTGKGAGEIGDRGLIVGGDGRAVRIPL